MNQETPKVCGALLPVSVLSMLSALCTHSATSLTWLDPPQHASGGFALVFTQSIHALVIQQKREDVSSQKSRDVNAPRRQS